MSDLPDLAGRVSLIAWRDPKTDPPHPNPEKNSQVFILAHREKIGTFLAMGPDVRDHPDDYEAWAELPTPSEAATVEDVTKSLAEFARLRALLPE